MSLSRVCLKTLPLTLPQFISVELTALLSMLERTPANTYFHVPYIFKAFLDLGSTTPGDSVNRKITMTTTNTKRESLGLNKLQKGPLFPSSEKQPRTVLGMTQNVYCCTRGPYFWNSSESVSTKGQQVDSFPIMQPVNNEDWLYICVNLHRKCQFKFCHKIWNLRLKSFKTPLCTIQKYTTYSAVNASWIYINKADYQPYHAFMIIPSKTSGAIQAALPLLLVMCVWMSQAVPKSQIFRTVPPATSSKLL